MLVLRAKRDRRLRPRPGVVVKVNVGCGLAVAPGWINVDGSLNALVARAPSLLLRLAHRCSGARQYVDEASYVATLRNNVFVHHDLRCGLPFVDGSVDFVYTSHFLEHLERKAALRLLADCHRVLKPGGLVRVAVPDLEHALVLYRRGEKDRMLRDYFFVEDENPMSRHRYAYDLELLGEALRAAGFEAVARREARQGRVPDLEQLDNREDYTLFVEAAKPGGPALSASATPLPPGTDGGGAA
jgi:predicted SAM-dependent methyltransferase